MSEAVAGVMSALASGSGDHAELARLADDLRKFEHHAVGSLKIGMDEVRRIIAACDAHAALLAENAALRADGEVYQNQADHEFRLRKEAERKLAEAVGLLGEARDEIQAQADAATPEWQRRIYECSRADHAQDMDIPNRIDAFLRKEAERG